jgi:CheY-like chemotaxis protein
VEHAPTKRDDVVSTRRRILVVDDDDDIRDSLAELIELRYDTGTAIDGKEALDAPTTRTTMPYFST